MKTKLLSSICHLALGLVLGATALAQTTTLSENNSTGQINTAAGVTPNIPALAIAGVTQWHTPQDYGAIGDGSTHPLSGVYSTLAAAQAAYPITIAGSTYSTMSTTVTCADATFLDAGYPVSGAGIPAGATVASVTDSTHFVLSATPTAGGSGAALASSYITALSQELDYAGMQKCVWNNGSMYLPAGTYLTGSSTLKIKSPTYSSGITLAGAGPRVSEIIPSGPNTDAIRVMQGFSLLEGFSVQYAPSPNGNGSNANGIVFDTGAAETNPPRYTWNFHLDHVYVIGFANGVYNPYKWDEGSITRCAFRYCGAGIKTVGNLDTLKISASDCAALTTSMNVTGCHTTNGLATVTCDSTVGLAPGMQVKGPGFNVDNAVVKTVDNPSQFTVSLPATADGTGVTLVSQTVALWVDGDGRACWSGGVIGAGFVLYGSGNVGALLIGEDLHCEGTGGVYSYVPVNGRCHLVRDFFADNNSSLTLAFVETGASIYIDGGSDASGGHVYLNGRCDARAINRAGNIDVNWNNWFHYTAGPYHVAADDESPGWPFWDTNPSAGAIVLQMGGTSGYPVKKWQYVRLPDNSLAWRLVGSSDGMAHLFEQALPGTPVDGEMVKDSTDHRVKVYDTASSSWQTLRPVDYLASLANDQTLVSSNTATDLTAVTVTLAPGTYKLDAMTYVTAATTTPGILVYLNASNAIVAAVQDTVGSTNSSASLYTDMGSLTSFSRGSDHPSDMIVHSTGTVTVTTTTTVKMQFSQWASSTDVITAKQGSYLHLQKIQ